MKKSQSGLLMALLAVGFLSGCNTPTDREEDYLQVIGEYEQPMPDGGYRLNLSYNGPMDMRERFTKWADSLRQVVPSMVLTNENIYMNYMPEQMGQEKIKPSMFQTSVTYNITVPDSATYGRIMQDALDHRFPFNVNVSGVFIDDAQRQKLQHEMMEKALDNARQKLNSLSGGEGSYRIVGIEELDSTQPYGPEYYEFNRRMVSRVRVKALLAAEQD